MDDVLKTQITNIKAALKKDQAEARKDALNKKAIAKLQEKEEDIIALIDLYQDDLKEVQKEIAERVSRVYDFSDPMTIKTMKGILKKLIKENQ